ncbi:polyphosphate:AMP phosphotransferase [Rhizobiales bacterium]|uniref:polyphosphate:AMP phosphotransferase n=1 Tax=Hongsoonwoonella zoysiae TaxID=2821844 RepID=UPI0015601055|nr:polyphosphate:AMP phosphotransferase [Hongsoonwoonella zoysiae]NRG16671.1 polyphosphate:AMP phosphotransferase [Hongsoonwoonella zoysiae]
MFKSAELPQTLSKQEFREMEPDLRIGLLQAQLQLVEERKFSVILVIAGLDGAGKNEAISRLHEWMDPRHLACNAYGEPTEEERLRPPFWRFWRDLPEKGEISIVVGSWYQLPMRRHATSKCSRREFELDLITINAFEEMLFNENVLILKFWFDLPVDEQKKRMKELAKRRRRVRHILEEWTQFMDDGTARETVEEMALRTSTAQAPWYVIPALDEEYRDIALGQIVSSALRYRLERPEPDSIAAPAIVAGMKRRSALDAVDLSAKLDKDDYEKELEHWQEELATLTDKKKFRDIALVAAFEGNDAAGKGGAIRRVTRPLDPRIYKVHPIAAPSDEEKARPYLWRFWRRIPRKGRIAIFDRSWYGRVLVERVEGFCTEADWMRAYNEINEFEQQLVEDDIVVAKFWLAISEEEQLARFKAREETAYKQFKITDEDWRNRLKWGAYEVAAGEMIDRTSTSAAPWTLVAAEDKRHARITVLKTLCKQLKKAL